MSITEANRLEELSGSRFEVADGQPDVRHWEVEDLHGNKLGKVDDLLFNPASRRVRYLVVNLKGNRLGLSERKVLLPIGVAILHGKDDTVLLPEVSHMQINILPFYEKGVTVTPDIEQDIRNVFVTPGAYNDSNSDFYNHEQFNQEKFYGLRYPGDNRV
ncbi:PRC-barrel domain-containing protein [Chitinophaga polysaccharea]|uniref:PRC-barrel domain-containing protein n=1 Tax=Chitinophaga polysaccharea TaxID=1293035 RepID=UPI00115793D1|nr:PRC-barrel domain-containing protein [Chitinophaga polysaccharea]